MRARAGLAALPLLLQTIACSGGGENHHSTDTAESLDQSRTRATTEGNYLVSYLPSPDPIPLFDTFSLSLSFFDSASPDTLLTDIESVALDVDMPSHGHGMMILPEVTQNDDGSWSATPLEFMMEGHWQFVVDVTRETTEQATFNVICCDP